MTDQAEFVKIRVGDGDNACVTIIGELELIQTLAELMKTGPRGIARGVADAGRQRRAHIHKLRRDHGIDVEMIDGRYVLRSHIAFLDRSTAGLRFMLPASFRPMAGPAIVWAAPPEPGRPHTSPPRHRSQLPPPLSHDDEGGAA